jgi:glycopeptide antibiotics resistance protein
MLAAVPLAVLTVWVLSRQRRRAGIEPLVAWRISLIEVGIVLGTLPWIWLTMVPGTRAGEVTGRVSLMPLRDLVTMPASQIFGNLLVFAAVGFLVPMRFQMFASISRILLLAAFSSMLIESAQYVFRLDRVSSVDDILLNTLGAGLAALASARWWKRRTPIETEPTCWGTSAGPATGQQGILR